VIEYDPVAIVQDSEDGVSGASARRSRFISAFTSICDFVCSNSENDKVGGKKGRDVLSDPLIRQHFKTTILPSHARRTVIKPGRKAQKPPKSAAAKEAERRHKKDDKKRRYKKSGTVLPDAANTLVDAGASAADAAASFVGIEIEDNEDMQTNDAHLEIEEDDFVSPITIETYTEHRLRVLLNRFESRAPVIAMRLRCTEILITLLTTSGTVLAALELEVFVALVLFLAGMITNIRDHYRYTARLGSINQAVRELRSLQMQIDGQTIVTRRSRLSKSHVVSSTEAAVMQTIAAETGVVAPHVHAHGHSES
jgi:hypothetical protein